MSDYLSREEITKLVQIAARHGMGQTAVRELLFAFINLDFYTNLPLHASPRDQVNSDLIRLNRTTFLRNYEVPLLLWLTEATQRLQSGDFRDLRVFEKALETVALESQRRIAEDQGQPPNTAGRLSDELEKIVGRDDMLAFGWLDGAQSVGQAVVRLTVPRYEGTAPVYAPSGAPKRYFGTGWLIGSRHIITNHHVVNARASSESDADDPDLHLQAQHTKVQFDYDEEESVGVAVDVAELVAWSKRGYSPKLDYAVLRLTQPVTRTPLTLAPNVLTELPDDPVAVNIIQHPGGNPKMLGIRNNLIHRIDAYELSYFTDTQGGSSGSPVCNDRWQVVGLHKKWQHFYNENILFQGKSVAWENRGTRIDKIVADLKQRYPTVWAEIGATVVQS